MSLRWRKGGRIQAGEKHGKTVRSHEPALAKVLDGAWAEDDHAVLSDALPKNDAGVRPPGPLFPWMPAIPFFFLGLGLYRAWIEIAFVTPIFSFPAAQVATHDACDIVMSVTLLLCAVFSRRLGPLFGKKWFYAVTVALMLLATVLLPISAFFHSFVVPLGWVAVLAGGVGTAFVILLWSELYGCLNPFRVALYYSGSLVIAAAVILLCRGMEFASFFAVSVALPLFSLGMVAAGFRSLPSERLPPCRSEAVRYSVARHSYHGRVRIRVRPERGGLVPEHVRAAFVVRRRVRCGAHLFARGRARTTFPVQHHLPCGVAAGVWPFPAWAVSRTRALKRSATNWSTAARRRLSALGFRNAKRRSCGFWRSTRRSALSNRSFSSLITRRRLTFAIFTASWTFILAMSLLT